MSILAKAKQLANEEAKAVKQKEREAAKQRASEEKVKREANKFFKSIIASLDGEKVKGGKLEVKEDRDRYRYSLNLTSNNCASQLLYFEWESWRSESLYESSDYHYVDGIVAHYTTITGRGVNAERYFRYTAYDEETREKWKAEIEQFLVEFLKTYV